MPIEPTFYIREIPIFGDAVLAPMAGYSDLPFRSITRRLGSALSYTEFVPAAGLLQRQPALYRRLLYTPAERPITFQIFGSDVQLLLAAALQIYAELQPDIIDINMGCWAPKVAENGAGAGLLRDPVKIGEIFNALSRALPIPVTGKIRLGWDDDSRNHVLVARVLADNGASLIAVHGRTKCQAYHGAADWDAIAEVQQAVKIPVLGNGDVRSAADIVRLKAHAGVPAVMIGRAAIGNPWIFQHRERWQVDSSERAAVLREHLALACQYYGVETGFRLFLRHATQYIYGVPGAAKLRAALVAATTPAVAQALIDQYEYTPALGGGLAAPSLADDLDCATLSVAAI